MAVQNPAIVSIGAAVLLLAPLTLLVAGCGDSNNKAPAAQPLFESSASLPAAAPASFIKQDDLPQAEYTDLLRAFAKERVNAAVLGRKSSTGEATEATGEFDYQSAYSRLRGVNRSLAELSEGGPDTYALVHTLLDDGRLKSWLIAPGERIVSDISSKPYSGTAFLTDGLGVTALASARAPRSEGAPRMSAADAEAMLARDRSKEAVAKRFASLKEARDQLLPGAVQAALGTHSGRLLIVGVRDTATAPYAAMFLRNGRALLNWSFVSVPDIDTLSSAVGRFDYHDIDLSKAVIVGDPDLTRDPQFDWEPLPGARAEAADVALMLGADPSRVLIGKEATMPSLRKAINRTKQIGLVYMATHAVADPKNPLTKGFAAMSGGHYYAGHIRQEKFPGWQDRQPLVVMSACQTALGRVFDGGGFGVAQSWTTAGAGQVVASLWNVSDEATRLQMSRFMTHLKNGEAPEIALQKAQIETMNYTDEKGQRPYLNNPKMWASFAIYGKPSSWTEIDWN